MTDQVPSKPFLSVIMPVHDGTEWIGAALQSLAAEAADDVELIVIDSSTEIGTSDIVEEYSNCVPLRLFKRTDLGPWQVKTNVGVEISTASHICILHQDDLWLPGRMAAIRRWIAEAPEAVLHLAPSVYIDRKARPLGPWRCPLPADELLGTDFVLQRLAVQNFISVPATVFSRSAWLACGGMDTKLWYTADWDMWAKLAGFGPTIYHDEITTAFRVHGNSQTVNGSRNAHQFRNQMETVLDRYLNRVPAHNRQAVEHAARASINVNVMLAAASGGDLKSLFGAALNVLSLGPLGMRRYFRDSRLHERVMSRVRAQMIGAY